MNKGGKQDEQGRDERIVRLEEQVKALRQVVGSLIKNGPNHPETHEAFLTVK
jgi:hypothetical protein